MVLLVVTGCHRLSHVTFCVQVKPTKSCVNYFTLYAGAELYKPAWRTAHGYEAFYPIGSLHLSPGSHT